MDLERVEEALLEEGAPLQGPLPAPLWPLAPNPRSRIPVARCYAVWWVPSCPLLSGVHAGGPRAWYFLLTYLPGQVYTPALARLRACPDFDTAVAAYRQESWHHGVSATPRLFFH